MRRTGSFMLATIVAVELLLEGSLALSADAASASDHSSIGNDATTTTTTTTSPCTLYMAPTSTKSSNHIKLSMYAGVDIQNGTIIGSPEIVIPIIHPEHHYYSQSARRRRSTTTARTPLQIKNERGQELKPQFFQELIDFMWDPRATSSQFETAKQPAVSSSSSSLATAIDSGVSIPGVGSLSNQHLTLVSNAGWDLDAYADGDLQHDPRSSKNVAHPGRGAYSQYNQIPLVAMEDIPAGMEILVNDLGDPDEDDEDEDGDKKLLSSSHFQHADEALTKIHSFFQKHEKDIVKKYGTKKIASLYKYLKDDVMKDNRHRRTLFPKKVEDLESTMRTGTFRSAFPEITKDVQWLKENGQCLDGIYTQKVATNKDPSVEDTNETNEFGGVERGAFATRSVQNGEFIAPVPLMLIPDKSYFDMYNLKGFQRHSTDGREMKEGEEDDEFVSSQLILNYSFGHEESSLLFYPYGMNINFINHRPTTNHKDSENKNNKSDQTANAKLVWTDAKYHRPELLALSPNKLMERKNVFFGLGMDIVATRDIEADEEVFIDYGSLWEQKWAEHVQNWNHEKAWDTKALDLNSAMTNNSGSYFHTQDEIGSLKKANNYDIPSSIMTAAYLEWEDLENTDESSPNNIDSETWFQFDKTTARDGYTLKPCVIVDRYPASSSNSDDSGNTSESYEYTVRLYDTARNTREFIKYVPQKYIQYVDKPYTSDLHTKNAFRHSIAIPDEIFPEAWRDLK